MASDQHSEAQLQREFLDYQTISLLEKLQRERPDLVQRFFSDRDGSSLAAGLREHNSKRGQALKDAAKPAAKPAGKPGSAKRGGWDQKDINSKVSEILRSR
jgi:hypothetical protein